MLDPRVYPDRAISNQSPMLGRSPSVSEGFGGLPLVFSYFGPSIYGRKWPIRFLSVVS